MKSTPWFAFGLVLLLVIAIGGCARTARDTQGFATVNTAVVDAPFMDAWRATKAVLRERGWDIYTRDKRGLFVAYTSMKRRRLLVPKRTQYTISLEPLADQGTRVTVETIDQVYGVTLLTYPGWHDRKTTDDAEALAILEAVQAKVSGA